MQEDIGWTTRYFPQTQVEKSSEPQKYGSGSSALELRLRATNVSVAAGFDGCAWV